MARNFRITPTRWLFAIAAVLVGIGLAWLLIPVIEREWALHSLFSADADQRAAALRWFFDHERSTDDISPVDEAIASKGASETRLARDEALARRIIAGLGEPGLADEVFSEAVFALRESDWWHPSMVPVEIWCRRIGLLVGTAEESAALTALDELMMLPSGTLPALVDPLWQKLIEFDASDTARMEAMLCGLEWLPPPRAERLIVAPALEDSDASIRRAAWMAVGLMAPSTGYQADWEREGEHPEVAEAILWASITTNPDVIQPIQRAVEQSPWPSEALPHLLSHCPNPQAQAILDALARDGNPAVDVPLLEKFGDAVRVPGVPGKARAWLGLGAFEDYEDDAVAQRWWMWRARANDERASMQQSRIEVVQRIGDVRADDGSVWAAVLLVERLLPPEERATQARQWMRSMNADEQRAGLLLAGLLSELPDEISRLDLAATDSRIRQYVALARLAALGRNAPNSNASVRASDVDPDFLRGLAYRLLRPELNGPDLDVLLALLASGDREAGSIMLEFRGSEYASERLIRSAWLIERFMPNAYEIVAPLSPWNESMAALQLDVLRVAHALEFDSEGDASTSVPESDSSNE